MVALSTGSDLSLRGCREQQLLRRPWSAGANRSNPHVSFSQPVSGFAGRVSGANSIDAREGRAP